MLLAHWPKASELMLIPSAGAHVNGGAIRGTHEQTPRGAAVRPGPGSS